MELIIGYTYEAIVILGTFVATALSLPLIPTIYGTLAVMVVICGILIPAVIVVAVYRMLDLRPSTLLHELRRYQSAGDTTRKMVAEHVEHLGSMLEHTLRESLGEHVHYAYFWLDAKDDTIHIALLGDKTHTSYTVEVPFKVLNMRPTAQHEAITSLGRMPRRRFLRDEDYAGAA